MGPRFRRMHRSAPKGLSLQAQERSDKTQAKPATERKARQARGVQGIPGIRWPVRFRRAPPKGADRVRRGDGG